MDGKRRTTLFVLSSCAALLSASMLAPAFGAPQAVSAASLAKKLSATLKIAKRADKNAKRAIAGLQVEGRRGPAGPAGPRGIAGAAGAQGAAGAKGDPGASATTLWANVRIDGSTEHQSGSTSSVKRLAPAGAYDVTFNRDVSACNYQATLQGPGQILAAPGGSANAVFIQVGGSAGPPADSGFYLAVFC